MMTPSWNALEAATTQRGEPAWMVQRRKEAWEAFEKMELPPLKYGITLRTNLKKFLSFDTLPSTSDSAVTIRHLPPGATARSFPQALKETPDLLKKYWMTELIPPTENKFTAFHAAHGANGTLIHIPPNTTCSAPLEIQTTLAGSVQCSSLLIIVEPNAEATIIEHQQGPAALHSAAVEVFVGEGAKVRYVCLQHVDKDTVHLAMKRAKVEKDAQMIWFEATLGGALALTEVTSRLAGQGAESYSYGIFLGNEEQNFDLYSGIVHEQANTTSNMLIRGAVQDKARSLFRGLVAIKPAASNSNGYQKSDVLILSEDAKANAIPKLEINNNEVKCSHGATISKVDKNKLFYLRSRGIPLEAATQMVVEGFLESVMSDERLQPAITEEFREAIKNKIQEKMRDGR